jgi:hypothetical protein
MNFSMYSIGIRGSANRARDCRCMMVTGIAAIPGKEPAAEARRAKLPRTLARMSSGLAPIAALLLSPKQKVRAAGRDLAQNAQDLLAAIIVIGITKQLFFIYICRRRENCYSASRWLPRILRGVGTTSSLYSRHLN